MPLAAWGKLCCAGEPLIAEHGAIRVHEDNEECSEDLLPLVIDAREAIIRGIGSGDAKHDSLHWRAFKPRVGGFINSAARLRAGIDVVRPFLKKAFDNRHDSYAGVAVALHADLSLEGVIVEDARDEYCGHVNMLHPYPVPDNSAPAEEPATARDNEIAINHYKDVAAKFRFVRDPQPEGSHWTGPALG